MSKPSYRSYSRLVLVLLLLALVPVAFLSHRRLDGLLRHNPAGQAFVPGAGTVRLIALGYDQLVADFYWLAFITYYGDGEARSHDHYRLAHEYLELITSLDPNFVQPYWFAAFAVGAEERRPMLADKIIARGIAANQNNWYLPYIGGINMYLFAHDDVAAARYYRMASKFPDAPSWLGRQADVLSARIPTIIKDLRTWDGIYRSEHSVLVKQHARLKLIDLWMRVYSSTNAPGVKARARAALAEFGISP